MRVIIITSVNCGIASMVLPELCSNSKITVAKVLFAKKSNHNRKNELKRKIIKTYRIGLFGALNGIRLRKWYIYRNVDNIKSVCRKHNIEILCTESLNHSSTIDILQGADAHLGVSLGNGYIEKKIFSIPEFGMINIHSEILPDYRGALDIIWPIHDRNNNTGFTIHQISDKIDKGNILYQKTIPIEFYPRLKDTVLNNRNNIGAKIPKAISYVCEHYNELNSNSIHQSKGKYYTTPTFSQFFRMVKNNNLMYHESELTNM